MSFSFVVGRFSFGFLWVLLVQWLPQMHALSVGGSWHNVPNPLSTTVATTRPSLVTVIAEDVWRKAADDHRQQIQNLLEPGLVGLDHELMLPVLRHLPPDNKLTMLDPKHPIYNFLVEYYGLKGLKGPKRLARWSPSVGLFLWDGHDRMTIHNARRIDTLQDYHSASTTYLDAIPTNHGRDEIDRGVFLEGATPEDFDATLYLQGAEWVQPGKHQTGGVLYRPIRYYDINEPNDNNNKDNDDKVAQKKATSFLWYKSILETTRSNEPVLHCYGLHEWAMQYQPKGAPPPPSGKYQAHLPLRVDRWTINQTVERKGLRCTHVDALRFFAPAAGPLNYHGASLKRQDQLVLEQPACVHAHMDLLKIALRIQPFCDAAVLVDVLRVALAARTLDVGASPYDCTAYSGSTDGSPIRVIPVETTEGRALYKDLQTELMVQAEGVRDRLLRNYQVFGDLSFSTSQLEKARTDPSDERFAKAEPGGRAWRHNLVERPESNGT